VKTQIKQNIWTEVKWNRQPDHAKPISLGVCGFPLPLQEEHRKDLISVYSKFVLQKAQWPKVIRDQYECNNKHLHSNIGSNVVDLTQEVQKAAWSKLCKV
jgi:hypothetical protein